MTLELAINHSPKPFSLGL